MLAWSVRISSLLTYVTTAVLALWTVGLPDGVPLPTPGLVELGWTVVGLVWVRVVALWVWWTDDEYSWMPLGSSDSVSLTKGRPGPLRRLAALEYESTPWVYLRQAAVWALVLVSVAALAGLDRSHGSEHIRSLLKAGAEYSAATVAEASDVRERRSDDEVVGYYATLVLTLPDGGQVRAENAYTRDMPGRGSQVHVLWAPAAPELGGEVGNDEPLSRYLNHDWGLTLRGLAPGAFGLLLVLTAMVPVAVAAEADGLQEQAWSPVAQTVHAVAITGVLLCALPYLSGAASGNGGIAYIGLLALYIGMPVWALAA